MNFDNIAKLVHELAENPNQSSALTSQLKSSLKVSNTELDAITKVFSKEEVSGNCLASRISTTLFLF